MPARALFLADVVPPSAAELAGLPPEAGLAAGVLGLLLVMGSTTAYFLTIDRERVPEDVRPFQAALVTGVLLGLVGLALSPGWATAALFVGSGGMGAFLLYLLGIRKLPDGALTARVGEAMPAFEALDAQGLPFDLAALQGRRLMVKFFRGSW